RLGDERDVPLDGELLPVLLAERREVRPHGVEELRHHRGDPRKCPSRVFPQRGAVSANTSTALWKPSGQGELRSRARREKAGGEFEQPADGGSTIPAADHLPIPLTSPGSHAGSRLETTKRDRLRRETARP